MSVRTPEDLQHYLDEAGIVGKIVYLDVPTPTVEAAAQAVGTSPDRIIKSVLFLVNRETPVLAIANGTSHIDSRAIAGRFGVGRKRVKLADAPTVQHFTGYPAGAVPPFGHATQMDTLVDPAVLEHTRVYGGGGSGSALLHFDPRDLLRVSGAVVVSLIGP
jgi:prolyl-tRNA editing enzyme YbaK/EbsC (Cys-tRNA(Pro) deacylase)